MSEKDRIEEQKHLDEVCAYINGLLSGMGKNILDLKNYIKEERARIWDDYMHMAPEIEDSQGVQQIVETEIRDVMRYERMTDLNRSLVLLADNPYFARLDVKDEYGTDSIYIGKRALMDKDGYDMIVCDWRSDIASLFYDADLGPASYVTESGKIDCELLLRRQLRISDGKIEHMIDSDIAIEDEILESELAKASDSKLKTILSTIQREQSVIIRDISADLVLVEGVAGSGKTSIALHRLAYLLYRFRKTLSSGNIIIFSVNNVFSSYIVDVLPDLGEDRAVQTGFYDYFKQELPGYRITDSIEQAEKIFSDHSYMTEVLEKGSEKFRAVLADTFNKSASSQISYEDIVFFDDVLRTKEEIRYLFETEYASYLFDSRRRKIREGIINMVTEDKRFLEKRRHVYERELTEDGIIAFTDEEMEAEVQKRWTADVEALGAAVDEMLSVDVSQIYANAVQTLPEDIRTRTQGRLDAKTICYEDMAALIYLKVLAGQIMPKTQIRHLLLDEAQEYSPVMFAVFGALFPEAKYTVVGDCRQSFIPYFSSLTDTSVYFDKKKSEHFFRLDKSYRSSAPINEYLSREFGTENAYFNRAGEPVTVMEKRSLTAYMREIGEQKGKSIAVICKTEQEGKRLQTNLRKAGISVHLMGNRDVMMPDRTVIIPSQLTKGLEFDEVIIADASDANWSTEAERRALYVSESRALHKLVICR